MKSDRTDHPQMVNDCITREELLSDWERGFIDSLSKQLTDGRTLTDKQIDRLDEIWEKVT